MDELFDDLKDLVVVAVGVKRSQRGGDAMLGAKRSGMASVFGENQVGLA